MKQIKITQSVKDQLDELKYEKETYNIVIQRLIRENQKLRHDYDKLYLLLYNLSKNTPE